MDPQKQDASTEKPSGGQPDKPLGRGLEQISHLFLTQKANAPQSPARPNNSRAMVLQPGKTIAKDLLVTTAKENANALEGGLRVIDMFVSCHPHSDIDLLAVDRTNQLTVIDFETALNDALPLRGLGHCDWIRHNLTTIRRMYPAYTLEANQPRLLLIAPGFSELTLRATRPLASLRIQWVRYQSFDTGGAIGISFEPIA
jgi:hypothetical protein